MGNIGANAPVVIEILILALLTLIKLSKKKKKGREEEVNSHLLNRSSSRTSVQFSAMTLCVFWKEVNVDDELFHEIKDKEQTKM